MSSFLLAPSARPLRGVVRALRELAGSAVTPLVPADYLDLVSPLRRGADLRGRVVALEPETADAVTVRIRPGRSWRPHRAGQYIRLGVDVDGVRQWRAYSLTSLRRAADGLLSVTVKAIPGGKVSNHVVRALRPGTLVHLDQAAGEFVLPEVLPAATLFVTAGSGITPVMGMLRNHLDELADVVVLHSAPTAAGRRLRPRAAGLGGAGPAAAGRAAHGRRGRADPGRAGRRGARLARAAHLGVRPHRPAGRLRGALRRRRPGPPPAHRALPPRRHHRGRGRHPELRPQGSVVEADGATPILDAGEDAGVLMPSGCRMGICFGCVVPLTSGAVRDLRNGELITAGEGDDVRIQTCVSAAAGPCTIDL